MAFIASGRPRPAHRTAAGPLALLAALFAATTAVAQPRLPAHVARHAAQGGRVPLIVTTHPGHDAAAETARHRGRVRRQLTAQIAAIEVEAAEVDQLAHSAAVAHLALDLPVHGTADPAATVGADQVWAGLSRKLRASGRGVGVAVIDSGVNAHPDLAPRIVREIDFTGEGAGDRFGHGTHVAGLIAGSGATSGGQSAGVAPGAHLVSLKVLDAHGVGRTSSVIAALEWVVAHGRAFGIRVVNLSIGHPVVESYRTDPLNLAVQRAVAAGFVVVASVGNNGTRPDGSLQYGAVLAPANDPAVLSVGAVDTNGTTWRGDDTIAAFSSRGPTLVDGVMKPDLVAPGRRLVSTAARGSHIATTFPDRLVSGAAGPYLTLSGTSMAAASVSGTVALMLDAAPHLTPQAVKAALQFSAEFKPHWYVFAAGAGSLNAAGAVEVAVRAGRGARVTSHPWRRLTSSLRHLADGETVIDGEVIPWGTGVTWNDGEGGTGIVWGNGWQAPPDVLWGNGLVWSTSDDHGDVLIWSNADEGGDVLIWSNGDEGDVLIWSNGLIWSDGLTSTGGLVWSAWDGSGDVLIWSNGGDEGDVLIWSNSDDSGDVLIWSNGLIWSTSLLVD